MDAIGIPDHLPSLGLHALLFVDFVPFVVDHFFSPQKQKS